MLATGVTSSFISLLAGGRKRGENGEVEPYARLRVEARHQVRPAVTGSPSSTTCQLPASAAASAAALAFVHPGPKVVISRSAEAPCASATRTMEPRARASWTRQGRT